MLGGRLSVIAHRRLATGALGALAAGLAISSPAALAATTTPTRPAQPGFEIVVDHGHPEVQRYTTNVYGAAAFDSLNTGDVVETREVDSPVSALGLPDPLRPQQWALDNVPYEEAWSHTNGAGVIVAVVDTGVRADHEDLGGRVLAGHDFVGPGDGRTDPNGHGTHVAGIIAANADNGVGIAGAAPGVHILPVRVLDAGGSGSMSTVAAGIIWAADHGARVINLSLGGDSDSVGVRVAMQYAISKGAIVVAAAGNNGDKPVPERNHPTYPGADPEAVAVAAVDASLNHPGFSNTGAYVDLAAPGVGVLSTFSSARNAYAFMDGTSMATPYVSAAAALVVATNPALKPAQVAATLEDTARDLGPAGPDGAFGHGLVNPLAAVIAATPKPPGFATKGTGYWVVGRDGSVRAYGKARFYGDLRGQGGAAVVAAARTRDGRGYWLASADGSVHTFGDARYYGSMGGRQLSAPIVGMSVSPTGRGYLLLGADGGIFTFGDARFRGSTGGLRLHAPVLDMTMTSSGRGYFMVASDGGVFTFGDARFRGSTGSLRLSSPVASMTSGRTGYWLVARDGGIFAFGVPFVGSLPGLGVQSLPPGVRIRALPDGRGYYILGQNGAVYTFGTARFFGSQSLPPSVPAVDLMLSP
jgi:type VII secretion-associated serine protease mycosin